MAWAWMLWLSHTLKDKRCYVLGMDALLIGCTWSTNVFWFGHGCSGYHRRKLKDERYYGLGMDALVIRCT